jgi:hypothetical protein
MNILNCFKYLLENIAADLRLEVFEANIFKEFTACAKFKNNVSDSSS